MLDTIDVCIRALTRKVIASCVLLQENAFY